MILSPQQLSVVQAAQVWRAKSGRRPLLALYFSAQWCGPCKRFTPVLADLYNSSTKMDVVFISCDTTELQFKRYAATMPWPSVPLSESFTDAAMDAFNVKGIPSLVLLDAHSDPPRLLCDDVRDELARGGKTVLEAYAAAARRK